MSGSAPLRPEGCLSRRAALRGCAQGMARGAVALGVGLHAGRLVAAAGASALGLSACGFSLRGATAMDFSRLHVVGASPQSSLGQELRRQLGGRVQLTEAPAQAEVVLKLEGAQREKVVTGLTATGLVRELVLRQRLRFSLTTPQGRLVIPPTDLVLQRDMATNESAALAKAREEEEIFRVLERDMVLQMVRRLEAASLSAPAPVPPPANPVVPMMGPVR